MTAPELKPCPFCRGEAETISLFPNDPHPGNTFVKCKSCMCATRRGHITTAIAAWNTRADLPPTLSAALAVPEVAELVGALGHYADTFCELGEYEEACGKLTELHCSGCKARAAIARAKGGARCN